jgi:hypothetical protein
MSKETDAALPPGKFSCWAIVNKDEDTEIRPSVTADKDGWPQIAVRLAIAEKARKGETQPGSFGERVEYQTIHPDAPARGGIETTPYEFAVRFLVALSGQSSDVVELAMADALESPDKVLVLAGLGSVVADCEVVKKNGFTNVKVFTKREITEDAATSGAAKIRERLAARGAGGAKPVEQANPFAGRSKAAPVVRQAPKPAPAVDEDTSFDPAKLGGPVARPAQQGAAS